MLSNMFDPMLERDPNWDQEIRDDVIEECNKHGGVLHIYVDKASSQVPLIFRPGSRFRSRKGPGS
jgi:RNA-binding protein 39